MKSDDHRLRVISSAGWSRRMQEPPGAGLSRWEKAYFLSQILSGCESADSPRARDALSDLSGEGGEGRCRVLLVLLDRYREFCQRYAGQERREKIERLMSALVEKCRKAFRAEGLSFEHPDKFIVLLASRDDMWEPRTEHQWNVWFESISQELLSSEGLGVSIILSGEGEGFDQLPAIYRQAKNAVTHKIFCPENALIFAENIARYDQKYYVYPVKEEDWMKRAIMRGDPEKAKAILGETLRAVGRYSPMVVSMVIYRLAIALSDIIDELQKGDFLGFPIEIPNSLLGAMKLPEFESISEIVAIFSGVIDAIVESLESKRGERHSQILDAVKDYIAANFRDSSCCMGNAARVVDMSPAYIGRLYKRYMLKSIAESIQEMRLESAKQMLSAHRHMTVSQIALASGFVDVSYFCKVFKKHFGATPIEFRKTRAREG